MDKDEKLWDIANVVDEKTPTYYTDMYKAWETKEQLELGKEVMWSSGGKTYVKTYTYTGTSTGSWSYTGVWFKPTAVRIQANMIESPSSSSDWSADGVSNGCQYDYWSSGTFVRSYRDNRIIYIPNNGNTTLKAATLTSMDSDGFTLNFTTNNALSAQFIITCWG